MAVPARIREAVANPATAYVLRAAAWFLFFLAALRFPWVQSKILLPFAALQGRAAAALLGEGQLRVVVDSSCTGSDAIAVCLGAILAFPTAWKRRLAAAAGGFALIAAVNTARIGTLSEVASDRDLFDLLHLRLWPALIILVAAGYALWWMRSEAGATEAPTGPAPGRALAARPFWPFLILATVLVGVYYTTYAQILAGRWLGVAAHWAATAAGGLMAAAGVSAEVSGGVLRTASGAWVVTPECVTTPLIPLFVAAVLASRLAWTKRLVLLALTPALFLALATSRLMVLALPRAVVGSHDIAIHAFYQLLLAALLVAWLARRHASGSLASTLGSALGLGLLAGLVVGTVDLRALRPAFAEIAERLHLGHGYVDGQGVLAVLPAFQLGLVAAIWAASGRGLRVRDLLAAAALLAGCAAVTLAVLGELSHHASIEAPVVVIRAWSLGLPLLVAWSLGWLRQGPSRPGAACDAPSPAS